jgi:nucleotide-binding universal stress UspA family protein
MPLILVATDFSTRSDLALRRARLLARQLSSSLLLLHVVDDDQPEKLIGVERQAAAELLHELARSSRDADSLDCEARVVLGASFQGILKTANESGAALIVLGTHRRQALLDTVLGTTVERTVRHSRLPVLIAKAAPTGPYRNVLITTDLSENSIIAAQEARTFGLLDEARTVIMHAIATPVASPVLQSSMTVQEFEDRLSQEEQRVRGELQGTRRKVGIEAELRAVLLSEKSVGMAIEECANEMQADLVIVGTHGRTGIDRWLLGSVAEAMLANLKIDVLAVPVRVPFNH